MFELSSEALAIVYELKESIANHDRQLESLRSSIETKSTIHRKEMDEVRDTVEFLKTALEALQSKCENSDETLVAGIAITDSLSGFASRLSICETDLAQLKSALSTPIVPPIPYRRPSSTLAPLPPLTPSPAPTPGPNPKRETSPRVSNSPEQVSTLAPIRCVSPSRSPAEVEFPFKWGKSKLGIISYLTRKSGGNVHDKGIVTVTAKSVCADYRGNALRDLVDLISNSYFWSCYGAGQWICWDFHDMRVRPTHYTIRSLALQSWVVESSLDSMNWTKIHHTTDDIPFTTAFAVYDSSVCRFIRLTQTGKHQRKSDFMRIYELEFFGTLLE
jgi:hypothetical protein